MLFDFISRAKKSLGAKIMVVSVLALFFVSSSTAAFFLYDKIKSVKLEMIHNGLTLLQVSILLSRPGLIEESREKLENEVFAFIDIIQKRDKDISEISVYNRNLELLLNKRFKDGATAKGSYKEAVQDRNARLKKISSGFFPAPGT